MIDWALFVLVLGAIGIIAWAAYREGVNEGWRQAGRWADDYAPDLPPTPMTTLGKVLRSEDRPSFPCTYRDSSGPCVWSVLAHPYPAGHELERA